jgi:hypothetical protein
VATPTIEVLEALETDVPCEVSRCPRKARALVMGAHHSKMACEECRVELSDREWLHVSTLFGTKPNFGADTRTQRLSKSKPVLNFNR